MQNTQTLNVYGAETQRFKTLLKVIAYNVEICYNKLDVVIYSCMGSETMKRIVLASKSPRRRELIKLISDDVLCVAGCNEEYIPDNMQVEDIPSHLAYLKAKSVAGAYPEDAVIGSDTVVICDGRLFLKPESEEDAFRMLSSLSGKTHKVITGCAIICGEREEVFSSTTLVEFYPLSEEEIRAYIGTKEPMDKAGAYGIQGKGGLFVKGIVGDYQNVVGLPVAELSRKLKEFM